MIVFVTCFKYVIWLFSLALEAFPRDSRPRLQGPDPLLGLWKVLPLGIDLERFALALDRKSGAAALDDDVLHVHEVHRALLSSEGVGEQIVETVTI